MKKTNSQLKRFSITLISLYLLGQTTAIQAATEVQPSVQSFFNNPAIRTTTLSPNGQYLAMVVRGASGRTVLGVVETSDVKKIKIIASSDSLDILSAQWINDRRLLFSIGDTTDTDDKRNGEMYAINRDGSEQVQITARSGGAIFVEGGSQSRKRVPLPWNYTVERPFDGDTDDVLVAKLTDNGKDSPASSRLYRLDSKTLRQTELMGELQPKNVVGWVLDRHNQPRFAVSQIKDRVIVHYRDTNDKNWNEVAGFHILDKTLFRPAFFDGDGQAYIEKNNADGYQAIYRYDPTKRAIESEPFFQVADFDVMSTPLFEPKTNILLGIAYTSDAEATLWLDERMKTIQKTVDDKLNSTVNRVRCRGDACVVVAFSDRDPGNIFLYKPKGNEWITVGPSRPGINPNQMARQDFYRYTARDGMSIPAYVTFPLGKSTERKPTVVLVHGGPSARTSPWGWSPVSQFLASRGYVVVEPDFRGSTGYGTKHFRAGWKQWGLTMQDDLADAANWAVKQGWTDKNRIAIAGASYGGYATLMGLIKHPEIFKCGINWVGVTDIDLLFSVTWSDMTDAQLHYGMPEMIGDPDKDAAQFRVTSPLANADKLTQPLLMGYGIKDRRVPLIHGTKFRDAVMRTNKNVEWVSYPEEGHGWRLEKNNLDFWTRVEVFLDKNLKSIQ